MHTRVIENMVEMERVIKSCQACCVGMVDKENKPYVLPFNFGYNDGIIYLHSAPEGKKIDILKNNPSVCISFSNGYELRFQSEQVACSYGMKYRSVLAFGKVTFIEDYDEKVRVLNIIMKHYTGKEFEYNSPAVNNVLIYYVKVEKFEGRVHGY